MPYSNKHLLEVLCSFEFVDEGPKWNSIYFGSYFGLIEKLGFSERQERKGFPSTLHVEAGPPILTPFPVPIDQMVFRHPVQNWGIILSKAAISFHVLSNYAGWTCFRDELINPFYEYYTSLGLGEGRRNCTIMYLNRFERKHNEMLSDYFTIASPMGHAFGRERNTILQRLFEKKEDLLLVTKLTTQEVPSLKYMVNLECGATSVRGDMPWKEQIEIVHAPIFQFFESIITQRQRNEL